MPSELAVEAPEFFAFRDDRGRVVTAPDDGGMLAANGGEPVAPDTFPTLDRIGKYPAPRAVASIMKTILALVLLALTPACFAQTEETLAPVECGWHDDPDTFIESCPTGEYIAESHFEVRDGGASACWVYDAVCAAPGTPPDACRRTHVDCQPIGAERRGGQ